MEVRDGFPAIASMVDDEAVSGFFHAFPAGDLARGQKELPEQFGIGVPRRPNAWDDALRHHQHVNGCLRMDVPEGQEFVGLMDDLGRDLAGDDFLEKGHVTVRERFGV